MNTKSNLIPRDELELLLSEYATGTIDKGLKARVEESLASYPDLQREVDSIRSAFTLVNRDAHNAAIDYETRNLSVHVVHALSSYKKRSPLRHLAWMAPAAVTAVLLIMLNMGGPSDQSQVASNIPPVATQLGAQQTEKTPTQQTPTVTGTDAAQAADTAVLESVKRTTPRRVPLQPMTREEKIVDDLVTDQIVSRMAFETTNDDNETVTGITDEEIDVLLAAVVSNESL